MSPQRQGRLARIAAGLEHVSDDDLLLVAEVVEDRAIASARVPVVAWEVTPEMRATRGVLREVTHG